MSTDLTNKMAKPKSNNLIWRHAHQATDTPLNTHTHTWERGQTSAQLEH